MRVMSPCCLSWMAVSLTLPMAPGGATAREAVVGTPFPWCCVASGLARCEVSRVTEDLVPVLFFHGWLSVRSVGWSKCHPWLLFCWMSCKWHGNVCLVVGGSRTVLCDDNSLLNQACLASVWKKSMAKKHFCCCNKSMAMGLFLELVFHQLQMQWWSRSCLPTSLLLPKHLHFKRFLGFQSFVTHSFPILYQRCFF